MKSSLYSWLLWSSSLTENNQIVSTFIIFIMCVLLLYYDLNTENFLVIVVRISICFTPYHFPQAVKFANTYINFIWYKWKGKEKLSYPVLWYITITYSQLIPAHTPISPSDAQFVSLMPIDKHMYVFYKELTFDYPSPILTSRVARVCLNDGGGNKWVQCAFHFRFYFFHSFFLF